MCLAKVYLGEAENNDFIMEDVARLRVEGNKLHLATLFGEQKEVEGTHAGLHQKDHRTWPAHETGRGGVFL